MRMCEGFVYISLFTVVSDYPILIFVLINFSENYTHLISFYIKVLYDELPEKEIVYAETETVTSLNVLLHEINLFT